MRERTFTFWVNITCGLHQECMKVCLTEEETKALYRLTYNLDEDATVDVDCITTEQFYGMEEKLGCQWLTMLTESDSLLDPLYEWLGELA